MSRDATVTEIAKDGLRYKSKVSGSPFGDRGANGGTMSCYKCGKHKPRNTGSFKKLLGQPTFVCGECKPITPATA
jgi:hypothetical protein